MIRKAEQEDLAAVVALYDKILAREAVGETHTGWQAGVYPTGATAAEALGRDALFVLEDGAQVVAAAKIDREQVPSYAQCPWTYEAPDHRVMVLHTLVVDPDCAGRGYATTFVRFYEEYARAQGALCLRMDTNETNLAARALYRKLGYREPGVVSCIFQGIADVRLVCLEKQLSE